MNRTAVPALVVAALTLAGCASNASTYTPSPTRSAGVPVGSNMPTANGSASSTCKLGWFAYDLNSNTTTGPFQPGSSAKASLPSSQKPVDAYEATLPSSITADWISVTFYVGGKKAGQQTTTLNVPQTGGTWSDLLVPDEAEANMPGSGATPLENRAGASCKVTSWGNAS